MGLSSFLKNLKKRTASSRRRTKNQNREGFAEFEQLEDRLLLTVRVSLPDAPFQPGKKILDLEIFNSAQVGQPNPVNEHIDVALGLDGKVVVRDVNRIGSEYPWLAETDLTPDQIAYINFRGGPLEDTFNNNTVIASFISGGDGNDVLLGGDSWDIIRGGNGDDRLVGNGGDDELFGENGADTLIGGHGFDLLFGGTESTAGADYGAVDILRGGAGGAFNSYEADRILVHKPFRVVQGTPPPVDVVEDQTPLDAVIQFTDPATARNDDGVVWAASQWKDEEIEQINEYFKKFRATTGNEKLSQYRVRDLPTGAGGFVNQEYVRYGEPSSNVGTLAWNYTNTGTIAVTDNALKDPASRTFIDDIEEIIGGNIEFSQTFYHEVGHNWDDPVENASIQAFRGISGWETSVSTAVSTFAQWKNPFITDHPHVQARDFKENNPWYFDNTAVFAREYGGTNPFEDYATIFAAYFMGDDYEDSGFLGDILGTEDIPPEKIANVQQLMNALSNDTFWKTTVTSIQNPTTDTTPFLDWEHLSGTAGYDLWVYSVTADQTVFRRSAIQTSHLELPDALPDGHYRFWVHTQDEGGRRGNWSEPGTFQIASPAAKPTGLTPSNEVPAQSIEFTWTFVPNASSYNLWVERSIDSDGDGQHDEWVRILNNNGDHHRIYGTSWTAPTDAPAGTYRFRVRAYNTADVPSAWSDWKDFTVAGPESLIVNSLGDQIADDGQLTLREALNALRTDQPTGTKAGEARTVDSRSNTIVFAPGLTGTIRLVNGELPAIGDEGTIIEGPGSDVLTVDALGAERIVAVSNVPSIVRISGLTFANGRWSHGGAIRTDSPGTLELRDMTFRNNTSTLAGGGAVYANSPNATIRVVNTRFEGNSADGLVGGAIRATNVYVQQSTFDTNTASFGGGIYANDIESFNSTFQGNEASSGGGLFALQGLFAVNSTFSGNRADSEGGGIYTDSGYVHLISSTVTENMAANGGGIRIDDSGGDLFLLNSIVAANSATTTAPDIEHHGGATVSIDYSLIGDGAAITADLSGSDGNRIGNINSDPVLAPGLGPLSDNGGATLTHAPLAGSPVLDQLPTGNIPPGFEFLFPADQRQVSRPQGSAIDIGAVEVAPLPEITVSVGAAVPEDGPANLVFTFSRDGDTDSAATVTFSVAGTATFNSDYTATGADSFSGTSGTVTIPAGQASTAVIVDPTPDTIIESDESVILTIQTATGYQIGSDSATGTITNDDFPDLTVTIAASSISENGGSTTATVSRDGDTTEALTVTLNSLDASEATVPATVTIPAGQAASPAFVVTAVDDSELDGTKLVRITAAAAGYNNGSDTINVTDDDSVSLTVSISGASISENGGSTTATVSRSGNTSQAITVNLSSSDTSEATVPATVTIAAGQTTSSAFTVTGVDDAVVDGTQSVTITASANGYLNGTDAIDVTDDDSTQPQPYVVTTLDDDLDGTNANVSLREAILAANSAGGVQEITFAGNLSGTITLTSGELPVSDSVTITGPGAGTITVDANDQSRVFNIDDGAASLLDVTILGLTITGGMSTEAGGAIYSSENLTLQQVTVSDSTSSSGSFLGGGGLFGRDGTVVISGSTFTGNSVTASSGEGAAVRVRFDTTLIVNNSTFSGNTSSTVGGGISASDVTRVEINNSTIVHNTGQGGALFLWNLAADGLVRNSILANNTATTTFYAPDYDFGSAGTRTFHNSLVEDGDTVTGTNNILGSDPMLGPLTDNGGPTRTHALLPGSPAIDVGNNAFAVDAAGNPLAADQRGTGFGRILDGDGNGSVIVDAGAVELPSPVTAPQITGPSGASGNRRPEITWTTFSGATSYDVYLELIQSGTNTAVLNTSTTGTSLPLPQNIADLAIGRYRAWVRASLPGGKTDWNTSDFQISLATTVTDLPFYGTDLAPEISWTAVPGAVSYRVFIGNATSGQTILDTTVTDTAYTPAADFEFGRHQIWVRAIGPQNYPSAWSAVEKYYIGPALYSVSPVQQTASQLNADLGLGLPEGNFDNWGGLGDRWVIDQKLKFYYILPDGRFYRWTVGTGRQNGPLQGTLLAQLTPAYNANLSLLTDPALNNSTFDLRPEFRWSGVAGVDTYRLLVRRGDTTVIDQTGISGTTFRPSTPLNVGDYRWWVLPYHANGRSGAWTGHGSFFAGGRPTVVEPANTDTSGTPTISWGLVNGAGTFEVYLFNDDGAGLVQRVAGVSGNSFTSVPVPDGNYRVWVKSSQANGDPGFWSRPFSFSVDAATITSTAIPTGPTTPTFDSTPTFQWTGESGLTGYELYLTNGTTVITHEVTGTSWTPASALTSGIWNWWVRGKNAAGATGPWSSRQTTDTSGRAVITGPSGTTNSRTPTISWTAVAGASRYVFQLDNLTTGNNSLIRNDNVSGTDFTTGQLTPGTYRAWVRAVNGTTNQQGPWSFSVEFTVVSAATPALSNTAPDGIESRLDVEHLLTSQLVLNKTQPVITPVGASAHHSGQRPERAGVETPSNYRKQQEQSVSQTAIDEFMADPDALHETMLRLDTAESDSESVKHSPQNQEPDTVLDIHV